MARIPTESRIFADRYFREARRLEALHASQISPGTSTWREALKGLSDHMGAAGSPIEQAAMLKAAITYMESVKPADAMHIGFLGGAPGKRSAALVFAAFSAGNHPLKGVTEEGLSVLQHAIMTTRAGADLQAGLTLTYVSKHAVARLHERNHQLTAGSAFSVFGFLGILGFLTRTCQQHRCSEMCLRYDDVLCVGSIKHAVQRTEDGRAADGSFLDVRSVLWADEVRDQARLGQGVTADVVTEWLRDRRVGRAKELAEKIPFLPRREDDYTLRSAVLA